MATKIALYLMFPPFCVCLCLPTYSADWFCRLRHFKHVPLLESETPFSDATSPVAEGLFEQSCKLFQPSTVHFKHISELLYVL